MAKFAEAEARTIKNRFVCRKCKSVIRATNVRVLAGKVKCRKCSNKALRPVRKK